MSPDHALAGFSAWFRRASRWWSALWSQRFWREAEHRAAQRLQAEGFHIISRNFRAFYGELDLVAIRAGLLLFCEVKARNAGQAGAPAEAITLNKQRRLQRMAATFLQQHPQYSLCECRFDALLIQHRGNQWHIEWLEDAFRPGW